MERRTSASTDLVEEVKFTYRHMSRNDKWTTAILLVLLVAFVVAFGPAILGAVAGSAGVILVGHALFPPRRS